MLSSFAPTSQRRLVHMPTGHRPRHESLFCDMEPRCLGVPEVPMMQYSPPFHSTPLFPTPILRCTRGGISTLASAYVH